MKTRFVEATQDAETGGNWGKFCVGLFDKEEWSRREGLPAAGGYGMLVSRGWRPETTIHVLDLQTGEGALFSLFGSARADLQKHRVWVCPMFEPFLVWLYEFVYAAGDKWFDKLPVVVELPKAEFAFAGYRRPGPGEGAAA